MVRAELIINLVKYGLSNDTVRFTSTVEKIIAEERDIQHPVLAQKLENLLEAVHRSENHYTYVSESFSTTYHTQHNSNYQEIIPRKRCSDLILPGDVRKQCKEIISEQHHVSLLRSYNIEPRNRILLVGPPGNGKTSLAEAIAESLSVPLILVKYDGIIGSYLGETASNIRKVIDYAKTRKCVLFFDEFETLGKERGDLHETGEIKRVVSSLLMQIDSLPSHVVVIGATNHEELLDRAVWRRFQVTLTLPRPTETGIKLWLDAFEKRAHFSFICPTDNIAEKLVDLNLSFAEIEEFGLSVIRQYVLSNKTINVEDIVIEKINLLQEKNTK